jgi:isocitrate dehydrogenase
MTKDLAICIHGNSAPRESYLNTEAFMDAIAEELNKRVVGI